MVQFWPYGNQKCTGRRDQITDKPNGKETAATGLQELSARQKKFLEKHHAEYLQAQADLNSGVAQLQLMQQKVRGQIATLRDFATDVVMGSDTPYFPAKVGGEMVVVDQATGAEHGLEKHLFVEPPTQPQAGAPSEPAAPQPTNPNMPPN